MCFVDCSQSKEEISRQFLYKKIVNIYIILMSIVTLICTFLAVYDIQSRNTWPVHTIKISTRVDFLMLKL